MRIGRLAAVVFLMAVTASGQAPAGGKTIVIKAARMFDGKSDRITSPGLLVVTDGKIACAGASCTAPAGAETLDLGDATLLPGFMDAHTHITGEAGSDWRQDQINGFQRTVAEQALQAAVYAKKTLMIGFTTIRNVGANDYVDVGLRDAINRGIAVGPRILTAAYSLGATGGHCDENGWRQGLFPETTPLVGVINGPDQARQAVRLQHKYGADVIKTCATGGVLSQRDAVDTPQLTQEELNALVDEAHALRMKTAAHAHGAEGAKRAIRAGIDSIEHGSFLDDEALRMMKERGTVLIPTLMAVQGLRERLAANTQMPPAIQAKARAAMAAISTMFPKAVSMGVTIGLGTDAAVYPHGRNAEEFWQMVNLGMKPLDALKAATSVDAKLLGLEAQLGTLEAGKLADIVATPGDPSQDIRLTEKVFFVMKEGVVYRNDRAR